MTQRTQTDPETLRTYAAIFEMPRRYDGVLHPPTEPCLAAAKALRFQAEKISESSPN